MLRALLLSLSLLPIAASAGTGREALDGFLNGLTTLQAKFEQAVLDTENGTAGLRHGLFLLQRPGKFRWDYVAPTKQVILADGRNVWVIEDDLKQVSQHYQRWALKGTPAAFLTTDEPIDKDFEVIDIGERLGMQWLELIPRDPDSDFNRVLLAFADNELRHLELNDKFGQVSRFRFFEAERNLALDPSLFVFENDEHWDVIHNN